MLGLIHHFIRMWNVPGARGVSRLSKLSLRSGDCDKKNVIFLRFCIINSPGNSIIYSLYDLVFLAGFGLW